ncbi:MAG: glycoside hydrolase family 43 protein [Gemmatimonadota bacterium]|nr:glycoside hydrolase family 43 protein [Gemmatimonadota bacterium]
MPTMRPSRSLLPAALVLLATSCSETVGPPPIDGGTKPAECTFTNPVMTGADPWVVKHNGLYYLVQSRDGGIWVYKSEKLTELDRNGVRVWSPPAVGWNRMHVWAPELRFIEGRWYIYYAAGMAGPPFIHQRSGVLRSVGEDPQGAYEDQGMLYTGDDVAAGADNKWAIDVTVTHIRGQLYAVWSGWEENAQTDRTPQHLYVAKMSNPWTISSNRVKISSPTESWERKTDINGLDLQEGPQFLERGGNLFIIYSTRESWLKDYRLGQLRLTDPTADPMRPESWVKSGPVFSPTGEVFGVGHGSFTTSPDGTEDWHVYHAKTSTAPGWERVIRMQKFTWKPDGSPDFGEPVPSGRRIPRPSGECR